ncbi:MAG TPA: hypothetical protein VG820_07080 [Fimbriimonadaceae bacterium]|nr:hypothetical protein [Fimbriimonadaceae bacterium]
MKVISVLIALVGAALAGAVDSFDYHCANIALLQDKSVQKEIGITEAERSQMNKFADAHRARLAAYQKGLNGAAPNAKVLDGYMNDLKSQVVGVMNPAQVKRLRELNLQAAGLIGLLDQVVATKIGFSDAQFKKYRDTYLTGRKEAETLFRNTIVPLDKKYQNLAAPYKGHEKEHEAELKTLSEQYVAEAKQAQSRIKPRVDAITKATEEKMRALITAKQKATWLALQGKKFTPGKK